ncbi:MAG TPA: methyltransferase domain-containing protein [Clostridiales bacterium]|uniref:Methyltransferase n=1 Tax=Coprothermobacter proteolyticus (strain ATCC 35245 / DSM 5265 / OCM 4 / BT) TaxID=309798 RepID=B5Y629_COPPD|nr:DNA methyltransferase [Coprothermobacter proteolyticus]ACI17547.1 DNA methylase N-4 [Coprothermobacter proteolyticus DSM 5265]HHY53734.1 methyltransferase domain-containing protein [Clostridiales bacterium]
MSLKVKCPICGYKCTKTEYAKHLESYHVEDYQRIVDEINKDIKNGMSIKDVAQKNSLTERFVKGVLGYRTLVKEEMTNYNVSKAKTEIWEPEDFSLETTTVWGFPDRGDWATHSGKYRGNWSPYIPRNVILRYSNENDVVLDQFVGSGTTLVEAKLLGRRGLGVDINPDAVKLALSNVNFEHKCGLADVHIGDARNLDFVKDSSIDLICTHPPYSNIIKYSDNIEGDLSHYDIPEFLKEMYKVASESYRVLKRGRFCAVLMGDTRRKGNIIPLGFRVMEVFCKAGLTLKEIVIKEQHNCTSTGYWKKQSIKYNFLLIAHEYLFIFKK